MPTFFNFNKRKGVFMIPAGATKSPTPAPPAFSNTKSLSLDGVDEYVDLGSSNNLNPTSAYTISAWVKRGTGNLQTICNNGKNAALQGGILLWSVAGKIKLYHWDTTWRIVESDAVLSDGVWYHVAGTWDGTTIKIYIDGVQQTSTFNTSILNYGTITQNTFIGIYNTYEWNGNIDEVALWNTALSDADINTIATAPSDLSSYNPVAWYRMGDNSTYQTPQILMPENTNKDKVSNYSLAFDGVDDYLETSGTFSLLDSQTSATFSMWIKPTAVNIFQYLFSIVRSAISTQFQVACYLDNVGRIRVFGDTTSLYTYSNTAVVSAGVWTHLCITFDLSQPLADRVVIYINGVDETDAGFRNMNITQFATSTSGLSIAKNQNNHLPEFGGLIDEFAIFNTTLNSTQVSELYNGGEPTTISGAVAYWKLGEQATFSTNWTVPDQVGSNDGTSANMTVEDRIGDAPNSTSNAVSFNMEAGDIDNDTP